MYAVFVRNLWREVIICSSNPFLSTIMTMQINNSAFLILFSAYVIVSVTGISIEGQLTVIRNDCYDRQSIGEKLSPTQTYKRFDHNTAAKCEIECTREKENCKAYSFGIGAKGNATCLLSRYAINETVDLKPKGTIHDPEFDLFVKKLDCQIVLPPPGPQPPPAASDANHHNHYPQVPPKPHHHEYGNIPAQSHSNNNYQYLPVSSSSLGEVEHGVINTLVSIASGPNSVRHPVHDIIVSGDNLDRPSATNNGQGEYHGPMPPFRPSALGAPYDDHKHQQQYGSDFEEPPRPFRPSGIDNHKPHQLYGDDFQGPPRPFRPSDLEYHKPFQHYGDGFGHSSNTPYWPEFFHPDNDRPDPKPPKYPGFIPYGDGGSHITIDRRKYESSHSHHSSFESESYGHGMERPYNYYDHYDRPSPEYPNRYGSVIPHPDDYNRPDHEYLFIRPSKPSSSYEYPVSLKPRPESTGMRPGYGDNQVYGPSTSTSSGLISSTTRPGRPSTELTNHYGGINYGNKEYGRPGGDKTIVTETVGYNGQKVTSIITELPNACFRRTMPGTRTVRSLVVRLVICETAEQCQRECGEEKRFTCEGFNYRLDPTGQGKGACELLDLPLSRIDLNKEIVPDPGCDLYTRDRNCHQPPRDNYLPVDNYGGGGHGYRYGYGNRRRDWLRPYDRRPTDIARPLRPPVDRWDDPYGNPPRVHPPPRPRPPPPPPQPDYGNRRGDNSYHHSHESHSSHSHHYNEHKVDRYDYRRPEIQYRPISGVHYLPIPPKRIPVIIQLDYDKYPGLPPDSDDEPPEKGYLPHGGQYGYNYRYDNPRPNYYIPERPHKPPPVPVDWGQYGGTYGVGGVALEYKGFGKTDTYDYWGFNKFQDQGPMNYDSEALLPEDRPEGVYLPAQSPYGYLPGRNDLENAILPLEPPHRNDFNYRAACFLRSASGFRLHKNVVKKILTVTDINECELLCFREKLFPCASYAFRYTSPNAPIDNCHLSPINYKEFDYYTDFEPDKEFDVYTRNNDHKCREPQLLISRDESDCFWRVRSGQRLDHSVVRDSLNVKSIVACQIECLKSYTFTCRAYSFRYGSPVIGGAIDNCQLTDWPLHELNPKYHFVPEPGFEIYKRGSFGHGCEPNHFVGGGRGGGGGKGGGSGTDAGTKIDQLCYAGFGSGSKLLPQATVKRLYVPTELDCKNECSKARESTHFSCMTLSYQTDGPQKGPNCLLSDILQRDLLPNVDFIHDPNTWLFSWDNAKPECVDLAYKPVHGHGNRVDDSENRGIDPVNPLDIWKVYSVNGWPCKRGTRCKENQEAGFWYCELEGGSNDAWDYCCSPDHYCGLSKGYPYSWCYVGPSKTQWRKCSDQYYPYIQNTLDRFDGHKKPWDSSGGLPPPPHTVGFRPDRPNAPVKPPHPSDSNSDQYEQDFNNEFLNPPKPGGFGQPRRWPVAYLHKELPPNVTSTSSSEKEDRTNHGDEKSEGSSNVSAIKNLINTLQDSEIQYNISSGRLNKSEDAVFLKIPLTITDMDDYQESPTAESREGNSTANDESKQAKSRPALGRVARFNLKPEEKGSAKPAAYRRGVVTRTNATASYKRA